MKKVLFIQTAMTNGGIEQALINLLDVLPKEDLQITVALSYSTGAWQHRLPEYCRAVEIPMPEKARQQIKRGGAKANIMHAMRRGNVFRAASIFFKRKILKNMTAELSVNWNKLKPLEGEFDLAVCYTVHDPFLARYVIEKVSAKRKIAFVHNDFTTTGYAFSNCVGYDKYDKYYAVSNVLKNELSAFLCKNKIKVFYNIVPVKNILEKGNEVGDAYDGLDGIKLLTVGRLNYQKGIDIAIETMKYLKNDFKNAKWFVVGSGALFEELSAQTKSMGLEDCFIFLGQQDNPYKFIKQCDIYVQPSRHEGYCTTVNEARVLNKPIVATDVSGTREMLVDGENGLIVQAKPYEIYIAIKRLLQDKTLTERFSNNLKLIDYTAKGELEDFLIANNI